MPQLSYASAGLSEREAAEQLLRRFAHGPTPSAIEEILDQGMEDWVALQLRPGSEDPWLRDRLASMPSLRMDNRAIAERYPNFGEVRKEAIENGMYADDLKDKDAREAIRNYAKNMGYRPQHELLGELIAARLLRAVHARMQLTEVWLEFWRNHLYVSARDNQARRFLATYERDALRPQLWGAYGDMLLASAQHPAMLLYLDNAQSAADAKQPVLVDRGSRRRRGLNENYARELLELHTLGVDGGYSQQDVEELARVLTGWTLIPPGERGEKIRKRLERDGARRAGFVMEGDFLFDASVHDSASKRVMGQQLSPGGGLAEGELLLRRLAEHPSTARHLSHKLAVHFVSEDPSPDLIDHLTEAWQRRGGDLSEMLWALVGHPEFWQARLNRVRSPLELAAAGVRARGGRIEDPKALARWVQRMGQPLYRYAAPTGWPDSDRQWIGAGTLVQRVDFLSQLQRGRVKGIEPGSGTVDLLNPEFQLR